MRRRNLCAGLLTAFAMHGALAAEVPRADAKKARAVIEAQLAAFGADDARRAFSLAAPAIRVQFGTAERFIAMVKQGYPVVYRPSSVAFLAPSGSGDALVQAVQMTDASGASWLAIYQLQRQPDRSWRIGGCQVIRNEGRAT